MNYDLMFSNQGIEKLSSFRTALALGGLGAGLGAMYGIGDQARNFNQNILDDNTFNRAAQGALSGLGAYAGSSVLAPIAPLGRFGGTVLGGLGGLLLSNSIISKDKKDPFYEYIRNQGF
jgi:hypothetical protein